jgi:hypothetical protein
VPPGRQQLKLHIRLVDFEDSGPSDRAFELATLTEHISAWSDARLDADDFLALSDLTRAEQTRVLDFRRLTALFWLIMLRPGNSSTTRNPPGTLERHADRLLRLLIQRPGVIDHHHPGIPSVIKATRWADYQESKAATHSFAITQRDLNAYARSARGDLPQ